MSVGSKIKYAAQNARGKAKAAAGGATGNRRLRAEGRREQGAAHVKHAADKAMDTAKNVGHEAKGKIRQVAGAVTDHKGQEAKGKAEQVSARGKEHLNK
jgi:uncharacterized protein YjbJ (UPF0337 family)